MLMGERRGGIQSHLSRMQKAPLQASSCRKQQTPRLELRRCVNSVSTLRIDGRGLALLSCKRAINLVRAVISIRHVIREHADFILFGVIRETYS
jgi:hypothetical protein